MCLRCEHLKYTLVYTVTNLIILNSYIDTHGYFFGLSGPEGECQGMGLWYFIKLIRCLLFKSQINRKTCFVSTFSLSVTYQSKILAIPIRLLTDKHIIIKLNLLRAFSAYARPLTVKISDIVLQMKIYLRFYSFTCRHLETLYTVAKKVCTVSRSRLWLCTWLYL